MIVKNTQTGKQKSIVVAYEDDSVCEDCNYGNSEHLITYGIEELCVLKEVIMNEIERIITVGLGLQVISDYINNEE